MASGSQGQSPEGSKPAIETGLIELLAATTGIESEALQTAIQAAAEARKDLDEQLDRRTVYTERELIYPEDEQSYVFRRGKTKGKKYYLRMYDPATQKAVVKSLKTADRVAALTKARVIYQEIKGKIARGERLKSITNKELVRLHLAKIEKTVTDIPHRGITPGTFKVKSYYCKMWLKYIRFLGLEKTSIDQIAPERTREFGAWFTSVPKETGDPTEPRSVEQINNAIAEVTRMFHMTAVRDRYLGKDRIPEIDRLKQPPDERTKRDALSIEEYEQLMRFMWNGWARKKPDPPKKLETPTLRGRRLARERLEKHKKLAFFYVIGILFNTGLRPKEFLGLRVNEITEIEDDDPELKETHLRIFIRAENAKTGRSRTVIAPIKNRISRIKKCYENMGVKHEHDDFLWFNPQSKNRAMYSRQALYTNLIKVLELSGLMDKLVREGKKISTYSARHSFISWRLRYGGVPIHLLATVAGTSVQKIMATYGHIEVEKQARIVTKNQAWAAKAGVSLTDKITAEEH